MSECDSSDEAVSVVVVVVGVNFFSFSTSSLKPLHGFASNFVWMFLGWTPTKFVKIRVLPLFFSKVTRVCSNQGCMTYFHPNMLMRFWLIM